MDARTRFHLHVSLAVCLALICGGCGYTFGPSKVQGVQTIHVPIFQVDSLRRNLGYLLTEAVQQEIKNRGGYRLTDEATADTILSGRIVDVRKNVLSEGRFDDPRGLQLMVGTQISWIDRRSGRILQQHVFPIGEDLALNSSQVSFTPETGQSLATAQQEAFGRLASQIVDLTEMPW